MRQPEPPPMRQPAPPALDANAAVIDVLRGRLGIEQSKTIILPDTFAYGYWIITEKSMFFYEFESDDDEELPWDRRSIRALDQNSILCNFPIRDIHSVVTESMIGDNENDIYLYYGDVIEAEFNNKAQKRFVEILERLAPGLMFLKKGLTNDYNPSISDMDPRNPYGTRYNPAHPRSYVIANTKGFPKNFNALDDAINAAKRDGILPADWNLAVAGFTRDKPIPGVPVVFDVKF